MSKFVSTIKTHLDLGTLVLLAGVISVMVVAGMQLTAQNQPKPVEGALAPDFELMTHDGEMFRLSDYQGQIVVVNFWGSWCGACVHEAPDLEAIWQEYQDQGVTIIGVGWKDTVEGAQGFLDDHGITYPTGLDTTESIGSSYQIVGTPENYIIGRDGRIAAAIPGPVTYRSLTAELDRLLTNDTPQ